MLSLTGTQSYKRWLRRMVLWTRLIFFSASAGKDISSANTYVVYGRWRRCAGCGRAGSFLLCGTTASTTAGWCWLMRLRSNTFHCINQVFPWSSTKTGPWRVRNKYSRKSESISYTLTLICMHYHGALFMVAMTTAQWLALSYEQFLVWTHAGWRNGLDGRRACIALRLAAT